MENKEIVISKKYITSTKERPIFKAVCHDFGYIERGLYKEWNIITEKYDMIGSTFALQLTDAITALHEFIAEYDGITKKSKFEILMCDGSLNQYGDPLEIKAYSINYNKAKLFRIIK